MNNILDEKFNEIREWIKSVSFKKTMFGGVDEADVWRKIDELDNLYEKALIAVATENEVGSAENGATNFPGKGML